MPPIRKRAVLAVAAKTKDGFPISLTIEDEAGARQYAAAMLPLDLKIAAEAGEIGSVDEVQTLVLQRPSIADLESIGNYLWSLLMPPPLLKLWEDEKADSTIELRFDVKAEEVAKLPLEALHDGGSFLASSAETRLSRFRKTHEPQSHPPEVLPLRVLIVVGEREPARSGSIDYPAELRALRKLFRRAPYKVDWEILERPSLVDLDAFCKRFRPHVFHFIGHGKLQGKKQEPALELWDEKQEQRSTLKRDDLKTFLRQPDWNIRVALFNACRSGTAGENVDAKTAEKNAAASRKAALDLGTLFIEEFGGCCAVSMQGDIKATAAAEFSSEFYKELIDNHSAVDLAVANARLHVKRKLRDDPDWIYPVLQVGCTPESAAPMAFGVEQETVESLKKAFIDLALFVDRTPERRELWASIAYGLWRGKENFAVVHGERNTGKTAIVRWLMHNHALRGYVVRLIDLKDNKTHDYSTILETIRNDGQKPWGYHQALPAEACVDFDAALAAIRAKKPLVEKQNPVADLFSKFASALQEVAKERPLLIVLDHFSSGTMVDDSDVEALIEWLFVPVAGKTIPNVKMIVVVLEEEIKKEPLQKLAPLGLDLPVDLLFAKDFERLALEMAAEFPEDFLPVAQGYASYMQKNLLPARWKPDWILAFHKRMTKDQAGLPEGGGE